MPDDRQSGKDHREPRREELTGQHGWHGAFGDVTDEHHRTGPRPEDPIGIGGADVARAVLADVDAFGPASDKHPKRDGAEQVAADAEQHCDHYVAGAHLDLKSMMSGTPSRPYSARRRFST